jgi:hypothetical protein
MSIVRCPHCGTDFTPGHLATRIEALETVLMLIAAIDPEGQRADDLGRVTRIAHAALAPEQD